MNNSKFQGSDGLCGTVPLALLRQKGREKVLNCGIVEGFVFPRSSTDFRCFRGSDFFFYFLKSLSYGLLSPFDNGSRNACSGTRNAQIGGHVKQIGTCRRG